MKNSSQMKGPGKVDSISVAIIASRYHDDVTLKLVEGAKRTLQKANVPFELFWVPGAYELPQAAQTAALSGRYDAIVALGCLIRGETSHFEYIAHAAATGLDAVGRRTGVAVAFGVLTVDSLAQALARSGGAEGNKGEEAALAAVELTLTQKEITKNGKSKKSPRTSASNSLSY